MYFFILNYCLLFFPKNRLPVVRLLPPCTVWLFDKPLLLDISILYNLRSFLPGSWPTTTPGWCCGRSVFYFAFYNLHYLVLHFFVLYFVACILLSLLWFCTSLLPPCCVSLLLPTSLATFPLFLAWDFVQVMTCTLRCTTFVIICTYVVDSEQHRCVQSKVNISNQFHLKDVTQPPSSYNSTYLV